MHQQDLAVPLGVIHCATLRVVATCEPGVDRVPPSATPFTHQLGSCLTVLDDVGARTAANGVGCSAPGGTAATRRRFGGVGAVDEVIAGAAADHIAAEVAE